MGCEEMDRVVLSNMYGESGVYVLTSARCVGLI